MNNEKAFLGRLRLGQLWSIIKDGAPRNFLQKLLSLHYPIALLLLIVASMAYISLRWKKIKKDFPAYLYAALVPAVFGELFGIVILNKDPECPAWIFPPWATYFRHSWLQTIEDWIFYIICPVVFVIVYQNLLRTKRTLSFMIMKNNVRYLEQNRGRVYLIFGIAPPILLAAYLVFFMSPASVIITLSLFLPAYILIANTAILDAFCWWHATISIPLLAAGGILWDMLAANVLPYLFGGWATSWFYISFDQYGNPHHSSVFCNYILQPYAWIGNSPVEIMFFCFSFTLLCYASCAFFLRGK